MKNFKIQEFVCRCGCEMPPEARQNIEALVANVLDPLREAYGKPIYVNSGYRCEKHNAAVGGVPKSQHLLGQAADISVKSEPTPEREESQACLSYPEREGGGRSQIREICEKQNNSEAARMKYQRAIITQNKEGVII